MVRSAMTGRGGCLTTAIARLDLIKMSYNVIAMIQMRTKVKVLNCCLNIQFGPVIAVRCCRDYWSASILGPGLTLAYTLPDPILTRNYATPKPRLDSE